MKANENDYLIASHPNTPIDVLCRLAQSMSIGIRRKVAENRSTPKPVLESLSLDPSAEVRAEVAFNTRTPLRNRWKLAMDDSPDVRYQIAENPFIPIDILVWLSADDNPYVANRAGKTLETLLNDGTYIGAKGGIYMSAVRIEQTLRRMLNTKSQLNKKDAERLKKLILADGYISRSERKVIVNAIKHEKLDDQALPIFRELLLQTRSNQLRTKSIA